jgi:hypothetical protein
MVGGGRGVNHGGRAEREQPTNLLFVGGAEVNNQSNSMIVGH